jgi:hypothetical protein
MVSSRNLLFTAACLSFFVAIFHLRLSVSPQMSAYFGAPPYLVAHSVLLLLSCWLIALVFAAFGICALSGAGTLRRLPYLKIALTIIGFIYLVRGMAVIPQLMSFVEDGVRSGVTRQGLTSSLVSLFIAMFYVAGTAALIREDTARKSS